jgi:hypothetical protein
MLGGGQGVADDGGRGAALTSPATPCRGGGRGRGRELPVGPGGWRRAPGSGGRAPKPAVCGASRGRRVVGSGVGGRCASPPLGGVEAEGWGAEDWSGWRLAVAALRRRRAVGREGDVKGGVALRALRLHEPGVPGWASADPGRLAGCAARHPGLPGRWRCDTRNRPPSPNVDSALGMKGGQAQPVAVAQGHGAAAAADLQCDKAFAAGGSCGSR